MVQVTVSATVSACVAVTVAVTVDGPHSVDAEPVTQFSPDMQLAPGCRA